MTDLRDRMASATAVATGAEGPLRLALDRLRRYGLGERVIKSALAAGIAWGLASLLPDNPRPVLAPLTAAFSISLTIAGSLTEAGQRMLGVLLGVAVALLAAELFGLHAWSIGLVALLALAIGWRLGLESAGAGQLMASALLVMVVGTGDNPGTGATLHLVNSAIGTAVGLSINWLVAPPSYLPGARLAVRSLGERLIAVQEELAAAFAEGITPERAADCLAQARAVDAGMGEVQTALDQAEESLRFNLLGERQRVPLARYARATGALEHAAIQTRVICRAALDAAAAARDAPVVIIGDVPRPAWLEPDALGTPLANLFSAIALAVEEFLALADGPPDAPAPAGLTLAPEIADRRADVRNAAARNPRLLLPDGWILAGELLSVADQLIADLAAAADIAGAPEQ